MVPVDVGFREELDLVQTQLREAIYFKTATFDELVHLPLDELDTNACPAIVLGVSRACGCKGKQALELAAIAQFIFFADKVHRVMSDDEDIPEKTRQFPVLVGDFLYGNFFLELCQASLHSYLAPLAEAICTMSEGAIARGIAQTKPFNPTEWRNVLERERASLTGMIAGLAADLAEVPVELQNKLALFGWYLGLAWAAWNEGLDEADISDSLRRAKGILSEIEGQCDMSPLYDLVDYIEGNIYLGGTGDLA